MLRSQATSANVAYQRRKAAEYLIAEAGSLTATEVTMSHVTAAVSALQNSGFSPCTKGLIETEMRRTLRMLATHGAPYGLDTYIPRSAVPSPRFNMATQKELTGLLEAARPHLRMFVLLCHDAGLRSGTAAKVSHENVRDYSITIRSKRQQVVTVPISGRLKREIDKCPKGKGPLVALLWGREISVMSLRKHFRILAEKLGAAHGALRPHDMRRTMANAVYDNTGDIRVVQGFLGHTNLKTTLRYLQRPSAQHVPALIASIAAITDAEGAYEGES